MSERLESLTEVMQSRNFYPTVLTIYTDKKGLFHGKVYGNSNFLVDSHKKQFVNELLEELDDEASVFLEKHTRGDK